MSSMFGFVSIDSKPMCLKCCAILTNDSTKKGKLELHQKSPVGKDREYFENKNRWQPVQLSNFANMMNIAKSDTDTMLFGLWNYCRGCSTAVLWWEACQSCYDSSCRWGMWERCCIYPENNSTLKWHYYKNTELNVNFVNEKMVKTLQKTRFSIQVDEITIDNPAIILFFVSFIHEDDIGKEISFIKFAWNYYWKRYINWSNAAF